MFADGYDWDIYEIFKEQLEQQLPKIESNILLLNNKNEVVDAVDDLFRTFHSYKPTSDYLQLQPMHSLVSKTEIVLSTLREEKRVVQDSVIEWLLEVKDQLNIWFNEMQKSETELCEPPAQLKEKVKISSSYVPLRERLKKVTILYADINQKRVEKIVPFLKKIVKDVKFTHKEDEVVTLLKNSNYDIVMLNYDKKNYDFIHNVHKLDRNKPVIAIFDKIDLKTKRKLIYSGINHTLTNPLNAKEMQKELNFLAKTYFNSKTIVINNKKIADFIQTLKPLPNTIFQIMQICDDEEVPLKDLIKVVKSDPIIAGTVLKEASSPLYGTCELKTVDQAISRLGKSSVKALALKNIYKNMGDIDLTPYKIDEDKFSKISMTRLALMLRWYSKISIADLSILSSTALLGNIGQLLISKELFRLDEVGYFQELSQTFDVKYAEEQLLHTTTTIVSSQILNYWKLSSDIVNVIAYSDNPNEAPMELKRLIVANNIVYKLVNLNGIVATTLTDDILVLMAENNLDTAPLLKALEHINSHI